MTKLVHGTNGHGFLLHVTQVFVAQLVCIDTSGAVYRRTENSVKVYLTSSKHKRNFLRVVGVFENFMSSQSKFGWSF